MSAPIEQAENRDTAENRKMVAPGRWYCLPCGKTYKSKFSLERHEKTNKHLREVREIERLSKLRPSEDPDQIEFWEENVEVDWQANPTKSSRLFEELLETSKDTIWFTYIQEKDRGEEGEQIVVKRILPPTKEVVDPRQYCSLYKEIFQGSREDITMAEDIPDILDQMLEEIDPTSLERMVIQLEENLSEDMPAEDVGEAESMLRVNPEATSSEAEKVEVTEAEVEELEEMLQMALKAVEESENLANMEVAPEGGEKNQEDGADQEQQKQAEKEKFREEFQDFEQKFMEETFPEDIEWLVL